VLGADPELIGIDMSSQIALVGDSVGFDGVVVGGAESVTFKGISIAIVGSEVSPHTGPTHPSTVLPATLTIGFPTVSIGSIPIVLLPTTASCGCSVVPAVLLSDRGLLTAG
jgi:uncharacterized Zn-binding protein involved in type VI secretion